MGFKRKVKNRTLPRCWDFYRATNTIVSVLSNSTSAILEAFSHGKIGMVSSGGFERNQSDAMTFILDAELIYDVQYQNSKVMASLVKWPPPPGPVSCVFFLSECTLFASLSLSRIQETRNKRPNRGAVWSFLPAPDVLGSSSTVLIPFLSSAGGLDVFHAIHPQPLPSSRTWCRQHQDCFSRRGGLWTRRIDPG